jgi:hypothetical protein
MPTLPSRFPVKTVPRADMMGKHFRKMIAQKGLHLSWEHSAECPCERRSAGLGLTLDADVGGNVGSTRQATVECPTCGGRGYRYHSKQNIRGVVLGATQNPDRFRAYGEMAKGMIGLTVNAEHRLNLGDRMTLRDDPDLPETEAPVQLYRETHTYEGEEPSTLRYPIKVRTDLDLVGGLATLGAVDVYVTDADGIAQAGGEKVVDVDFTVDANGAVAWINPPAVGARWSISYYASPVYIVTDLPHPFRDTLIKFKLPTVKHESLPIHAMCTLEFLVRGKVTGT